MVIAFQAPRIGIGIGTLSYVGGLKAGIFADAVNSISFTSAGATSLVPCKQSTWNFAAHVGGEYQIKILDTVSIGAEHSVEVATANSSWYTPMLQACEPKK